MCFLEQTLMKVKHFKLLINQSSDIIKWKCFASVFAFFWKCSVTVCILYINTKKQNSSGVKASNYPRFRLLPGSLKPVYKPETVATFILLESVRDLKKCCNLAGTTFMKGRRLGLPKRQT